MCGRFPACVSLFQDEKTRAAKKAIISGTVWHYAEKYPDFVTRSGDASGKRGDVSTRRGNESTAVTHTAGREPIAVISRSGPAALPHESQGAGH